MTAMTWDRKEAEELIAMVRGDLVDTSSDAGTPKDWTDGWDAALKEYGASLADQLEAACAEIDSLRTELAAMTADRDAMGRAREADAVEAAAMMRAIDELRCGDLDAFHDGELSDDRREDFKGHLATCARCAAGLLDIVHVAAIASAPPREPEDPDGYR